MPDSPDPYAIQRPSGENRGPCFPFEPNEGVRILGETAREDFQRHAAMERQILRDIDIPHPARPEGRSTR